MSSGEDVDALFGPLWEAAGLPGLPTYTEAGAQTVNPPAEEAEVQAVPATSDVGLHPIPVLTRTVGFYTAGTSWADTLPRGMSVADVVQAVTERLGESMPSIVARLAGEGVSHNSPGFRRLFCLVATAAGTQRAFGRLFVQRRLEQQTTAPGDEAALHAALRGLGRR